MERERMISKVQLQARKDASSEWGALNTVLVLYSPDETEGKALKKAHAEANGLRNRWIENYIPNMQFRVVELSQDFVGRTTPLALAYHP